MIVEGGDRGIDLDAPVGLELLGDARVDVAVGPDDEIEAIDLALGSHAPRAGLLAESSPRQSGRAETRGRAENAPPAQLPFAHQIVAHVVPPFAPVMTEPIISLLSNVAGIEQKAGHGLPARMRVEAMA
jgi:hypothetical protein